MFNKQHRERVKHEPKFRITFNGLWYRIEYFTWNDEWIALHLPECYSNLPNNFSTLEAARRVYDFLVAGGDSWKFEQVFP